MAALSTNIYQTRHILICYRKQILLNYRPNTSLEKVQYSQDFQGICKDYSLRHVAIIMKVLVLKYFAVFKIKFPQNQNEKTKWLFVVLGLKYLGQIILGLWSLNHDGNEKVWVFYQQNLFDSFNFSKNRGAPRNSFSCLIDLEENHKPSIGVGGSYFKLLGRNFFRCFTQRTNETSLWFSFLGLLNEYLAQNERCSQVLFKDTQILYIQINFRILSQKSEMQKESKQWTPEETKLLIDMKNVEKHRKWKEISQCFQERGLNRSHIECRNKWVNSLAPEINHKPWTEQELQLLFVLYQRHESRWTSIQKQMPGRTQTKIKNHFYGVLRGITRFILKYFKQVPKKQTEISNKITPISLQLMYKGTQQFSFLGNIIPQTVAIMGFRFNKHKIAIAVEKNLSKFQRLNKQILQQTAKISSQGDFDGGDSGQSDRNYGDQIKVEKFHWLREEEEEIKSKEANRCLTGDLQEWQVSRQAYVGNPLSYLQTGPWICQPTQIALTSLLTPVLQMNHFPSSMEYYLSYVYN